MIERKRQLLKGASRLLDIGSTINRSRQRKSVQEEAREIISRANYTVKSIVYTNVFSEIKEQLSRRQDGVTVKEIEDSLAKVQKEVEEVKSSL